MNRCLILPFLLLILSCQSNKDNSFKYNGDVVTESFEAPPITTMPSVPSVPNKTTNADAPDPIFSKKIIKTGGIDFQSKDVEKDYKKVVPLLTKFHAYIENENQSKDYGRISYKITIRVPSSAYDSLYSAITDQFSDIKNKHSNIQDVTDRYYDLDTRIRNKKALEQRYIELLEKAQAMKDILEIENKLNEVRTEIEGMEGQFKLLKHQISLSTIHLSFYEELPYSYAASKRRGFGARILGAMDNGWQILLSFFLGIITIWPFIVLFGLIIFFLRRFKKKKRYRRVNR